LADGNRLLDISIATPPSTFVSLSRNHLSSVAFLCPSKFLSYLNLEYCKLASISDNIHEMFPHLQTLILSNNQISSLPDSLCQLTSLSYLQVSNNLLALLPSDIGNLSSLNRLDVRGNQLRKLPVSIWRLSSLLILNASSNQLETFPLPEKEPTLGSVLKVLNLADNKLNNVYGTLFKAFSHFSELVTINLGFNLIDDVSFSPLSLSLSLSLFLSLFCLRLIYILLTLSPSLPFMFPSLVFFP